jgi:hypothetical protein
MISNPLFQRDTPRVGPGDEAGVAGPPDPHGVVAAFEGTRIQAGLRDLAAHIGPEFSAQLISRTVLENGWYLSSEDSRPRRRSTPGVRGNLLNDRLRRAVTGLRPAQIGREE